jgi:hypothetical protein
MERTARAATTQTPVLEVADTVSKAAKGGAEGAFLGCRLGVGWKLVFQIDGLD